MRLLLAGIVLVAATGKLVDPKSGRQAMVDFGVPSRWAKLTARVLPAAEIFLGLALLIDATAPVAALGLSALFLMFALGVANLLRQSKAPPCNCFGSIHSEPVSQKTLWRVVGMMMLSLLCFALPVFEIGSGFVVTAIYASAFLLVRRWALVSQMKRENTRLSPGQRLPAVHFLSGEWLEDVLPQSDKVLIVLSSPTCLPCNCLKNLLSHWATALSQDLPIVEIVILTGEQTLKGNPRWPDYGVSPAEGEKFLCSTPGAFLVDRSATLLHPPAVGPEEIRALIRIGLTR